MTLNYRTTKIPAYYFVQIEETIKDSPKYVSVSEFIRNAIEEKLQRTASSAYFLLYKDIVFNPLFLQTIHEEIAKTSKVDKEADEEATNRDSLLQQIINMSLSTDLLDFLSHFLVSFAKIHPFVDGNKRTSWIAVDVFLRLLNKKPIIHVKPRIETKDELFIWKNATNQVTNHEMRDFLEKHIVISAFDEKEPSLLLKQSLQENQLLLHKLSR